MRRLVMLLVLAAGCDRQLNADWCSTHRDDQDCINAGLVQVDAHRSCTEEPCTQSGLLVCDPDRGGGICVQCVPGGLQNPPNCRCASDDVCHECLVDADCGAGGLCLPDYTCVGGGGSGNGSGGSGDNLLYAKPMGATSGDCATAATACTLAYAITKLDATHTVIELAAGTYAEGPLAINTTAVLIGPSPGSGHQYRDPTDPTGRAVITAAANGPVLSVSAKTVSLFEVTVAGSKDASGIKCTNGTLTVYHSIIRDNPQEGIAASGCALTIERSMFTKNGTTGSDKEAIYADNCSPIAIRGNFVYGNGNGASVKGAVHFHGATMGDFRFNTVAYNKAKTSGNPNNIYGGVLCESSLQVISRDNIVSMNTGTDYFATQACPTMNSYIGGDPKLAGPTDPHLTTVSPTPAIVNNSNSDCTYAGYDIDFDARPQGNACDLGADEYQ
jgi:hypothetical protein